MKATTINVTKSYLPPKDSYYKYLDKIWENSYLTNQGPLVQELNEKLKAYLNVRNFELVSNGTIALMLALQALNIHGAEVITTPFSYVATTSSILWQSCKPVFADIDPNTLCIDPKEIEKKITPKTRAIMPVHVFGMPCNIKAIEEIAKKYHLYVIYDGAHAFGAKYNGKSLLSYGDICTCSFHATKLYHTVEGGAVIVKDDVINERLQLAMRFGHNGDLHYQLGINGKNSEFHAAMGLANLEALPTILANRKRLSDTYDLMLSERCIVLKPDEEVERNYGYYPVIFHNEAERENVQAALNAKNIFPRRYFYPSLNQLPYVEYEACPISEDIASRILCLPLYPSLDESDQAEIIEIVLKKLL